MAELADEALDRHAVLQRDRRGRAQRVHQPADRRAFLAHGQEQLARLAVLVQPDGQIALVSSHVELVRERTPRVRQTTTHGAMHNVGLEFLDRFVVTMARRRSQRRHTRRHFLPRGVKLLGFSRVTSLRLGQSISVGLRPGLVGCRRQRLTELAPIAVQRVGLQTKLPAQLIARLDVLHRRRVGHVDRLADRTRDERLRGRHHADVTLGRDEPLAQLAAGAGTIEH